METPDCPCASIYPFPPTPGQFSSLSSRKLQHSWRSEWHYWTNGRRYHYWRNCYPHRRNNGGDYRDHRNVKHNWDNWHARDSGPLWWTHRGDDWRTIVVLISLVIDRRRYRNNGPPSLFQQSIVVFYISTR